MKSNISEKFKKDKCCGCSACADICPQKAIKMVADQEGFYYPSLNLKKCVKCHLCVHICPMENNTNSKEQDNIHSTYVVKNIDMQVRLASRSGGVFSALSTFVLDNQGIVYGCVLNDKFEAQHFRASNKFDCNRMRGSKYVQSNIEGIYAQINKDLQSGLIVLFTGTPCQTQAVKNYIPPKWHKNLYLVDIVCHGVPSPLIWQEYLRMIEKKFNGKTTAVNFRNKIKYGWADHIETVSIDGIEHDSQIYTNLFYNHYIIRPSCFHCPYKCLDRSGNITIADCWGIDSVMPDFDDNKGVSLVLINDDKGKKLFQSVSDKLEIHRVDINQFLQPPFKGNFIIPSKRRLFWRTYHRYGIEQACRLFGKKMKPSLIDRAKRKLYNMNK